MAQEKIKRERQKKRRKTRIKNAEQARREAEKRHQEERQARQEAEQRHQEERQALQELEQKHQQEMQARQAAEQARQAAEQKHQKHNELMGRAMLLAAKNPQRAVQTLSLLTAERYDELEALLNQHESKQPRQRKRRLNRKFISSMTGSGPREWCGTGVSCVSGPAGMDPCKAHSRPSSMRGRMSPVRSWSRT